MAEDAFIQGLRRSQAAVLAPLEAEAAALELRQLRAKVRQLEEEELLAPLKREAAAAELTLRRKRAEGLTTLVPEEISALRAELESNRGAAELDVELRPLKKEALASQLKLGAESTEAERELLPLTRRAREAELLQKIETADVSRGLLGLQTETLRQQLEQVKLSNELNLELLREDPSGGLATLAKMFTLAYPDRSLPRKSDGSLDVQAFRQLVAPIAGKMLGTPPEAAKLVLEEAVKAGVPIVDETGGLRPIAGIQKDLASVKTTEKLPPTQRVELTDSLASVQDLLTRLQELKRDLFVKVSPTGEVLSSETRQNVVGPLVGSLPARSVAAVLSPGRYTLQRRLQQLTADLTRQKTKELKGALSNKELAFIEKSVAGLTDNEEIWREFINRTETVLKRAVKRYENLLKIPETEQQGSVKIVASVAEARKLPPGTYFILESDPSGTLYRVPNPAISKE